MASLRRAILPRVAARCSVHVPVGAGMAARPVGDNAGMESTHEPRLEAFSREVTSRQAPRRDIVVLGSTGSIGTQAADIVRRNPDRFRIVGLAAGGGNPVLPASQALEFGAEVVAVASEARVDELRRALQAQAASGSAGPGRPRPLPKILA